MKPNFKRHKKDLLDPLRKVYERSPETKPFDEQYAWKHLRVMAYTYLRSEAEVSQKQATMPAADRVKLLRCGTALRNARREADRAIETVRGHWFVEWAETHGNPDFLDPIIDSYGDEFDKRVAGLKDLEETAFRAAETVRKKRGRPGGTTVLSTDFIINLESTYRDITKVNAGAGPGPFARFVKEFLTALGRECTTQTVIEAIKDAKKRDSRWGQSLFDGIGGEIPFSPPYYAS